KLFLESGFNVVCDKPVTYNLAEAKALQKVVKKTGKVFALTHNYTGNVMVKQARELVQSGFLGEIRKVVAEYPQGWLSTLLEKTGQKQAGWRTDAQRSGVLRWRHRNPRGKPHALHHRTQHRLALRGPDDLREGAGAGRRRQYSRAV